MRDIAVKCINDFCDVTSSKRIFKADYLPEGVPFYRAKEISEKHNGRELSDRLFISREKFETFRKKFGVPQDGDLLLTSIGALLGEPYVVSNDGDFYFKDGNLTWFRNFRGLNSKYLYYWLISPQGKAQLSTAVIGSAQPAFTIVALKNMSIKVPSISDQSKVVAILSAYDDLIENNTRRIAILEEMAQAIYREWFVNFRFPGHENVKLVDSPLGKIPEGWRTGKLDDILVLQRGFDLPINSRIPGPIPIYASTGVTGFHNQAKVTGPGVLTGRSGSLGTVTFIHEDYWPLNTTLWIKAFKWGSPVFAFFVLSSIDFQTFNSGAAVPSLNRNNVHGLPVVLPAKSVIAAFDIIATDLFAQTRLLRRKNDNLRSTRDLLLPKLISGQLDVEDLDIDAQKSFNGEPQA